MSVTVEENLLQSITSYVNIESTTGNKVTIDFSGIDVDTSTMYVLYVSQFNNSTDGNPYTSILVEKTKYESLRAVTMGQKGVAVTVSALQLTIDFVGTTIDTQVRISVKRVISTMETGVFDISYDGSNPRIVEYLTTNRRLPP